MTAELAALRGRLAAAEETMRLLESGIRCDVSIIRGAADPYEPPESLRGDLILAAAQRISIAAAKYRATLDIAERLRKDLGAE
jgi:hypothetical protein